MICHFETKPAAAAAGAAACCQGARAAPQAGGQVSPEVGAQGPPPAQPPSAVAGVSSTLAPVFQRLVGREVKVIAGCHMYCGRVIQPDPLTLIGPAGEVMIIAQAPSSVQY